MREPTPAKKLRKIHLLCVEFADLLDNLPFKNKTDEAKARGFLNGIRKVLSAENIEMEAPAKRVKYIEFDEPKVRVDPEVHREGLAAIRRNLERGHTDGE